MTPVVDYYERFAELILQTPEIIENFVFFQTPFSIVKLTDFTKTEFLKKKKFFVIFQLQMIGNCSQN